jgi:hypothetical protein
MELIYSISDRSNAVHELLMNLETKEILKGLSKDNIYLIVETVLASIQVNKFSGK